MSESNSDCVNTDHNSETYKDTDKTPHQKSSSVVECIDAPLSSIIEDAFAVLNCSFGENLDLSLSDFTFNIDDLPDSDSQYLSQSVSSNNDNSSQSDDDDVPLIYLTLSKHRENEEQDVDSNLNSDEHAQENVSNNPDDSNCSEGKRGRKRKKKESDWKRNVRQRSRNSGKEYVTGRGSHVKSRLIGKGCGIKCRHQCHTKFTTEQRENIFHQFWSLNNIERQRDFITKCVSKISKKQSTTDGPSQRQYSLIWNLIRGEEKVKVCKTFLLHTLGIKEGMVYTALDKTSAEGILSEDKRGKHHNRRNKSPKSLRDEIRDHIHSFPRIDSHYTRKESSREYLETDLSLSKMYHLYVEQCQKTKRTPGKKWLYNNIFNSEFNLSFFSPKKDQCDVCEEYKNATESHKETLQDAYDSHIKNKNMARLEKDNDKLKAMNDDTYTCACFDLQKVLTVPNGQVSSFYYKRKLSVYNFTIFDIGRRQGYCYMWHEGIGGRGSNEISTCIYHFLQQLHNTTRTKRVVFYSDNCGGQNKNKFIAVMYAKAVADFKFDSISHKYLEKGHTQNEGDSMHALIERTIGKSPIYLPEQYYIIARLAKKNGHPYCVKEMTNGDFLDFKSAADDLAMKNLKVDEDGNNVNWMTIIVLEVTPEAPSSFFYKTEFADIITEINFHRRMRHCPKIGSLKLNKLFTELLPITKSKYDELVSLCKKLSIPEIYHNFYKSLPRVNADNEE